MITIFVIVCAGLFVIGCFVKFEDYDNRVANLETRLNALHQIMKEKLP